MKNTRTQLISQITDHKSKIAENNFNKTLNEKVLTSQRLGSERVEQAKHRVCQDTDLQRAIELSLLQMKQEKAQAIRDKFKKEKIDKAIEAQTSTLTSQAIENNLNE